MKIKILFLLIAVTLAANGQQMALREASVSEVAGGRIGFPAVLTPRRLAPFLGSGTNTLPGMFNSDGTIGQLGYGSIGTDCGTAIGWGATAHLNGAAVGYQAAGDGSGVGFGYNARGGQNGTAVGNSAEGQNGGVAVGENTVAYGAGNVAIGRGADANSVNDFTDTAEIGAGTATVNGAFHYRGNPVVSSNGNILASVPSSVIVGVLADASLSTNVVIQNWTPAKLTNNMAWWDFGNSNNFGGPLTAPTNTIDLSGNGRNLTFAGSRWFTNYFGNGGIFLNGGSGTNVFPITNKFTIYMVMGSKPYLKGDLFMWYKGPDDITPGASNSFGIYGNITWPGLHFGAGKYSGYSSRNTPISSTPNVITLSNDGTNWLMNINGRTNATATSGGFPSVTGTFSVGETFWNNAVVLWHEIIVRDGADSPQTRAQIENYLGTKWGALTTNQFNGDTLWAIGDSITAGTGTTNQWTQILTEKSFPRIKTVNVGAHGFQSSSALSEYQLNCQPYLKRGDIVVSAYGANDITAGTTAGQIYTNMLPVWRDIKNKGAKVFVCDILQRTNVNSSYLVNWTNYNNSIDGWVTAGVIDGHVRYNSNTNLFPNTPSFYSDDVHPNGAGQVEMFKVVSDALTSTSPKPVVLPIVSSSMTVGRGGSATTRAITFTDTNIWDDINFSLSDLDPAGLASAPALTVVGNRLLTVFDTLGNDTSFVNFQMPHTWVTNTPVYTHFHYLTQDTDPITNVWEITYSTADIGQAYTNEVTVTNQIIIAGGTSNKHVLVNVPTNGIPMTHNGPSTIGCTKFRLLSGNKDAHIEGFDVHYRVGGSQVPYNP